MNNRINPHHYIKQLVTQMRIQCHMEQLNQIMPINQYDKEDLFFFYNFLRDLELSESTNHRMRHRPILDDTYNKLEFTFGSNIYDYLSINNNYRVGEMLRLSIDTPIDYPILRGMDGLIIIAPSLDFGECVYDKLIFNQKYLDLL